MLLWLVFSTLVAFGLAEGDLEIGMKTQELIEYWGYPVEMHKCTTKDGYILTMHRIPHGKNGTSPLKVKPVVFLQHGLEVSSSNFVANLPWKSLGFMLADAGYDVWIGNSRGELYSVEHETLSVKDHEYWQFTWYHMYKYDTSAMVDYVLQKTGHNSLYYIGHSQGTLTMFAKLAAEPEFAPKIKKFFAMAPIGTVKYIQGLMGIAARDFHVALELLYNWFGADDFMPDNAFIQMIEKLICKNFVTHGFCDNLLFLIAGPESNQFNTTRLPVYITDIPAGTSTLNVLHWIQMVLKGTMAAYDYGSEKKNMEHYGTPVPESYDLSKITTETYIYWSDTDWLSTGQDVKEFLLPNYNPKAIKENVFLDDFNHLDYIWGERAAPEIYLPIINILNKDNGL